MSRRIAILAALPAELTPLVRGWGRLHAEKNVHLWTHRDPDGDEILAACAGMGARAVQRAFNAAEAQGRLDLVLSVGLAGATGPGLKVGEVSSLTEIVDAQTGERFPLTEEDRTLRIATVPGVAGAAEKVRLLSTYGAVLVDMEAATVARLAAMRALPMCCFKAVSDDAEAVLPEIDRFIDADGQMQALRFGAYLAARPRFWGPVGKLARGSKLAASALAESLSAFLQHKDWAHTNRTGNFLKPRSDA